MKWNTRGAQKRETKKHERGLTKKEENHTDHIRLQPNQRQGEQNEEAWRNGEGMKRRGRARKRMMTTKGESDNSRRLLLEIQMRMRMMKKLRERI